jgi:hypothetical protein
MLGSARFPLLCAAAVVLAAGLGCSRKFFRERADKDVAGVITEKNVFPDWQVRNWHVYPDPRARFADKCNPDRPPYPPDDYAARLLSPNPQRPTKKSGVGRVDGDGYIALLQQWDAENRAADPPPPARGADPGLPYLPGVPAIARGDHQPARHAPIVPSVAPPASPTGPAPTAKPAAGEFGPWVRVPSITVPSPARPGVPTVSEVRGPIMVVGGEVEKNGKTVPAVAVVPLEAQPPDRLPPPLPLLPDPAAQRDPKAQPDPKKDPGPKKEPDPKMPPPVKPGDPKKDGPAAPAGDPAADYLRALETGQVGYRIKVEQAIQLGLVNAREFQDRREDLYLTALQVTQRRFDFAAQPFLIFEAVRESTGRALAGGGESWRLNTDTGFTKLFPTGALLVLRIANQVVVDLSGDNPTTSVSNLAFSLAQPFLLGGGYAVTLEPLTNAERTMVYAMRSYARFRKLFYVAIVGGNQAGGGYTNNPYGLQGLSPNLGRGIGGNLTSPVAGYLPLLQQSAAIANQRKNVAALEDLLRFYQAAREGGQQSDLQVGQVEARLLDSRGNLLGQAGAGGGGSGIRGLLDAMDNFKLQLGLPVTVGLELDDTPLRPIRQQLAKFEEVYAQLDALGREASRFDPAAPPADFRARWRKFFTDSPLVRGTAFAKNIGARWDAWAPAKLTDDQVAARLAALREERRKLLAEKTERQAKGLPEPETEARRLAAVNSEIDLGEFEQAVRVYEARPWARKVPDPRAPSQVAAFRDAFNAFYLVILEARNERQAMVRAQWPELPPLPVAGRDVLDTSLDEAYTAAIQTALTNRLDLMNARGQVVDAYRQIAFTANSLQGVFDVRYDLNSSTPPGGNDPLAFSADRSRHQLTFNAELPLVRRAERNNYRAALVAYQRQRRTLMAFEDNIANDVRADLRQLRTIAQLYRIQQRVVELGYSQVDNARALLSEPPVPGAQSAAGNAAALTQQVLDAQNRLLQAQNTLYQLWVSYLNARMTLYLDLEQMTIDERGVWCDEFSNRTDGPARPDAEPGGGAGERLHAPRPVGGDGR